MKKSTIILMALLMSAVTGSAAVQMPRIFQSGMVLQRGTPIPVWGQADPGETVTVTLNKKVCQTTADAAGHWRIDLPSMKAGGPYTLVVESKNPAARPEAASNQAEARTLSDVWIGDVWLCTGQSNMETTLERVSPQYPDELNDSNALVRLFHVQYQTDTRRPSSDLRPAAWQRLNRENAWRFSAIGYFLGKQLQREKGVAQGIIESAWGGTPIEAWIAADTIARHFPLYSRQTMLYQDNDFVAAQQRAAGLAEQQWQRILNQGDPGLAHSTPAGQGAQMPLWTAPDFDDSQWATVNQYRLTDKPSPMAGRREWIGSLWLRQHIFVDAAHAGKSARLLLGTLYDSDVTYINGVQVGSTGYQYPPRRYQVPEGVLRQGDNVIAVRFINKNGMPHFIHEKPYRLVFADNDVMPLGEQWKIHEGVEMPRSIGSGISLQNQPSTLFNGMISPLAPFAVAGVVWYQGESNTGMKQAGEYAQMLRLLMANWREAFERPQMPFVIVQLANYMAPVMAPQHTGWSVVREAQRTVAKEDAHAELALTIDLGETVDIHPLRKKEVAQRIALDFERLVYGKKVVLAPEVLKVEVRGAGSEVQGARNEVRGAGNEVRGAGSEVVLTLDQPMREGTLKYFELADAQGRFHNAEATAEGSLIVISSTIANPTAVRYAWKDNPLGVNVYSKGGLPLAPFEITIK